MSPRENRRQKAARLLTSGAVRVRCGDDGCLVAVVQGDSDTYIVHMNERGRTVCPCPSWSRDCSHAIALSLVAEATL
jgi:uncharacterized Zn finger protein